MSTDVVFGASQGGLAKNIMRKESSPGSDMFSAKGSLNEMFSRMSGSAHQSDIMSISEPKARSFHETIAIDDRPNESVVSTLAQGTGMSFAPQAKNISQNEIKVNSPESNATGKMDAMRTAKVDNQTAMGQLVGFYKEHQNRAAQYLGQAAKDMGMSAGNALKQIMPGGSNNKITAGIAMAAEVLTAGGGSLATALRSSGTVTYLMEGVNSNKNMSWNDKKKLISEVRETIQQKTSAPQDTRISAALSGGGAPKADPVDENLAKLNLAKTAALLEKNVEHTSEFKDLTVEKHAIDKVSGTHEAYKEKGIAANISEFEQAKPAAAEMSADKVEVTGYAVAAISLKSDALDSLKASDAMDLLKKNALQSAPSFEIHMKPQDNIPQMRGYS